MLTRAFGFMAVLSLVALVGCGGGADKPKGSGGGGKKDPATSTTPTTKKDPAAAGGGEAYSKEKGTASIKGSVNWDGEAPPSPKVDTAGDAKCHAMHKDSALLKEDVVVKGGKVANVIVYVKSGADKWTFEPPAEAAVLDQQGCQYKPHVLAVMTGQDLLIKNSDELAHNVHATPSTNEEFNMSQSNKGQENKKKFTEPEFVPIKCDIHKWMNAYVGVFAHPFFAVTGEDGSFEIKGLPPGEYEVAVWHEQGKDDGKVTAPPSVKVTVADKEAKTQDFTFKAK